MKPIYLQKLNILIDKFIDDRDWNKFHSPKNLAMALIVECGELVEIFQWLNEKDSDDFVERYRDYIHLGYLEWEQQYLELKKVKTELEALYLFYINEKTKEQLQKKIDVTTNKKEDKEDKEDDDEDDEDEDDEEEDEN